MEDIDDADDAEDAEDPGEPVFVEYELKGLNISATVPALWYSDLSAFGVMYYNIPSTERPASNSPKVNIKIEPELERFDFYIDDFEDLESIDGMTISGIEMTGRSYKNIGMEWIEYNGVFDDDHAIAVLISRIDLEGEDAISLLESIAFDLA